MKQMLLAAVIVSAGIAGLLLFARRKAGSNTALNGNAPGGLLSEELAARGQHAMG